MSKKGLRFTEKDIELLGLTKNEDGTYSRKIGGENKTRKSQSSLYTKEDIITTDQVKENKDFEFKLKTQWFITYNVPSKKNAKRIIPNRRTGKFLILPSELHESYKKMTAMQYSAFGKEFKNAVNSLGLQYPLYVEFIYVRGSKHRFDYTNATDTVLDLMVSNGWIDDDSADHIIPIFKPYQYDKENPGVYIRLL